MEKKKGKKIILIMLLCLLLINLTAINGYLFSINYGNIHLNPGEKYIVNIPFIKASEDNPTNIMESPIICGTAEDDDGEGIEGVKVKVNYADELTILRENETNEEGEYCITLPKIESKQEYEISLEYDNETFYDNLILGNNNYDLGLGSVENVL